jgi:reverse transcriptase-like protein
MRLHTFSALSLAKVIRAGDSHRFSVNLAKNREAIITSAVKAANEAEIDFTPTHTARVNKRSCVSLKNYNASLALRSVSVHLSRKFQLKLMNRDEIVLGVIRALNDAGPMHIIRRDISSFYETIPTQSIKERLSTDTSISKIARQFLKQFFENYCPDDVGVPRGLSLSATLAELSLQDFDHTAQRLPGVYRYFRFSDDILLFCFKSPKEIMATMENALPPGMQFNKEKSSILPVTNLDNKNSKAVAFEYLGYRFSFLDTAKGDKPRPVVVSISQRKITKLKSRIILSLKRYSKDKNYTLLRDRLRFLSGNYRVRRFGISAIKTSSHIKSGIYYSYRQCGTYSAQTITAHDCLELKELDGFYFSLIKSTKSRYFWTLKTQLTTQQYNELRTLSFFKGFDKRMTARFAPHRVRDIKSAWKNA